MVTPNKSERLYLQLWQRIAAMQDGEPFPTVRQLMAEYSVSQSTVTPAINQLKEKGLLEAHVGRGSFVRKQAMGKPRMLLLQNTWPSDNFKEMASTLQACAESDGFRFEHRFYDYRDDITPRLNSFDADVIVIDAIANDLLTSEQIMAISHCPIPIILSRNSVTVSRINYVCGDNTAAGMNTANHLYHMGHRKFGLLINEPHIHTANCFIRGFRSCAASHGCSVEVLDCGIQPGESARPHVEKFMNEYAAGKYDFTALFPISCDGALVAHECLQKLGLRVPEDLSIISAGAPTKYDWLTAVDSGIAETCHSVIKIAHDILGQRNQCRCQIEFPQRLIIRKSVLDLSQTNNLFKQK